jgi:recombination protein RecT
MSKTASTQGLQNAIENQSKAPSKGNTGIDPYRKAQSYLKAMMPAIAEALPKSKGMDAERLCRITLTTLKQNPKLLETSIESLLGCVLTSAQLGLDPSLGNCYFIPYKNTCSFQISYKGLIDLVCRSGNVVSIVAQEVRKGDHFHFEYGRNETLVHKPAPNHERGEIEYFYAYAVLKNGGFTFQVMHTSEIEEIRNNHSISYKYDKQNSIWVKHYIPMSLKTVIKRLVKYLPIATEVQAAIQSDETVRKDITADAFQINNDDGLENVQSFEIIDADKNVGEGA